MAVHRFTELFGRQPNSLQELQETLATADIDLISELKSYMSSLTQVDCYNSNKDSQIILIVDLPQKRNEASEPETHEVWAFLILDSISNLGEKLGIWEISKGVRALLIPPNANSSEDAKIVAAKVIKKISREIASLLNGFPEIDSRKIVLIGVGALGSQIFMNLIRAGFGSWTLIDNDCMLPHNLSRHALDGCAAGYSKARALSVVANTIIDGESIADFIIADVLSPKKNKERVAEVMESAEVIIDVSTSIAVERFISRDKPLTARSVSIFLNPSGTDSVLLIEDSKRTSKLDNIEMQVLSDIAK